MNCTDPIIIITIFVVGAVKFMIMFECMYIYIYMKNNTEITVYKVGSDLKQNRLPQFTAY